MLALPSLLSAGLWLLGLAGVLATLSYADWLASLHHRRRRSIMVLPRLLSPFCLAFAVFGSGMALAAITNPSPSWWQIAAWSILAVIFAFYAATIMQAGRRNGWDTPIEGMRQP
jgi:hypothetical protein